MSLQRYVRQLKPIQENKTDYVNKVQMLSEGSTEAAKEMEYLLVHVANGRIPPAKKKFKNLKPYAQKNGFKKPEDLGKKILQNAGLSGRSGSMVDAQPVNNPTWKGSNTTPKTDIIIDKKLGEEIIKSKRNDLDATFDKQSNDTMTPAKLTILQRSRSFYIRDELLKLGYDAIKTKEGYTLLRHHQFLPTELVKGRGIRNSTRRRLQEGGRIKMATAGDVYRFIMDSVRKANTAIDAELNTAKERSKYIYDGLIQRGWSPEAAAGMLGNFAKESGDTFRHNVVQGELYGGTPIVYTQEDIDKGIINRATGELKTSDDIGKPKKGMISIKTL